MKKINILNIFTLIITSALFSCSYDYSPTDTSETCVPIALHYSGMVSAEVMADTRSASPADSDDPLLPGTEIGLFVLHEQDYENMRNGVFNNRSYGYYNIRGVLLADGNIEVPDTTLFYPLARDSKVAIIAYTPYDTDLIEDTKELKGSIAIFNDQRNEGDVLASDFIVGVPLADNPIRNTDSPIELQFRHMLTKVELMIDIHLNDLSLCEGIDVVMNNVPTSVSINVVDGSINRATNVSDLKIASFPGINQEDMNQQTISFICSAIILPYSLENIQKPKFSIIFRNCTASLGEDFIVERTDDEWTEYLPGKLVRYHIGVTFDSQ